MENKKGRVMIMILAFVFIVVFFAIFLGSAVFMLNTTNEAFLGVDLVLNDQNFTEVYQNTTQIGINQLVSTADNAGLLLVLGMLVVMSITGYIFRTEKRLWIAVDIFVILVAFITGVYLVQSFETFVATTVNITDVYSDDLPDTFRIVSNLPILIPVFGVIVMFATYGITRKKEQPVGAELGF